jgi:hypothetical protein
MRSLVVASRSFCSSFYRLRESLRPRHDDDDGREVAVSGSCGSAKIFSPVDRLGRETIRAKFWNLLPRPGKLIDDEIDVYWRCRAVDAGEEEERNVLLRTIFDATETVFGLGLDCSWALMGCCWGWLRAAAVQVR